ncbi:MAG: metal-dependent hydrolase, partial [Bdellovibrionia bacterium]
LITAAAILPDIDGLSILGGIDAYQTYHHTFGHNFFAGMLTAILCVALSGRSRKFENGRSSNSFGSGRLSVFLLGLVSYHSHLFEDLLGSGADWGITYLWPILPWTYYFKPPWVWELASWQNVAATMICIFFVFCAALFNGRTIVELFSLKTDAEVVRVLRARFGRRPGD